MGKISACTILLCLIFLNSVHGGEVKENAIEKECLQEIQSGGCDDQKCFSACQKQFNTTESAYCLPDHNTCQCYYTCTGGQIVSCFEMVKLAGCTNGKCYGACVGPVAGAASGTCVNGDTCRCDIPC